MKNKEEILRAIEQEKEVKIIVDDTPEAVLLSYFDTIRRELSRLFLKKLVLDCRIYPTQIEEVVTKYQKELEEEITSRGKNHH